MRGKEGATAQSTRRSPSVVPIEVTERQNDPVVIASDLLATKDADDDLPF